MRYHKIAEGLNTLVIDTRKYADGIHLKVQAMQANFFKTNPNLYKHTEKLQIDYYLKAALYKSYLATIALEQLWSLSYFKRNDVLFALQNSLETLDCDDDEILAISFAFENFLFLSRAFLDFYMLYLCLFLKTGHEGKISQSKFYSMLNRAQTGHFAHKANQVDEYFKTKVFAESSNDKLVPENWGTLVQSLRDKIAHQDRVRPNFASKETLLGTVLFNWPTLQGMTYDRFCQFMENGMFSMVTEISSLVYDLEWKPGPYTVKMYD
ncbi:MAG: hypothetical protein KDE54_19070 [Caldilineaceae bacterium]|nr:hypothetical protein [Caldilineaceae bacterium]MCB0143014.1 hypothetical protein [Caldilineaceae bacterium]